MTLYFQHLQIFQAIGLIFAWLDKYFLKGEIFLLYATNITLKDYNLATASCSFETMMLTLMMKIWSYLRSGKKAFLPQKNFIKAFFILSKDNMHGSNKAFQYFL